MMKQHHFVFLLTIIISAYFVEESVIILIYVYKIQYNVTIKIYNIFISINILLTWKCVYLYDKVWYFNICTWYVLINNQVRVIHLSSYLHYFVFGGFKFLSSNYSWGILQILGWTVVTHGLLNTKTYFITLCFDAY